IKEYAKKMAQGICQLCDKEAPFLDKQGNPFLEVHHINYLSNGGEDKIDNVVALCPNCHRRIHMLEDEEDFKKILKKTSLI
ncbi:HNH endonuclease, partial [Priestia aryabhattai]|uniref:HNH endonuclease n=2 Tax=Bacillaceae TaxID=186817 RepID=UPI002E1BD913